MATGDHRKIDKKSVPAFKRIADALVRKYGSINKAVLAAGISDHAYYRLVNDGEIVACVARKIVACYERTKSN